jgi:hypothetical protein
MIVLMQEFIFMKIKMRKNIKNLIAWLALTSIFLGSCLSEKNSSDEQKMDNDCSYKRLVSYESKEKTSEGHSLVLGFELAIKPNIKKLAEGDIDAKITDTTFIKRVEKMYTESAKYSSEFIERHNAIVDMLCSIERDLKDTTLNDTIKQKLFEDRIRYRGDYMKFLIGVDANSLNNRNKEDYLESSKLEAKKRYEISDHDKNIRGILIPPKIFPIDSIVWFDLGGVKGGAYTKDQLRDGSDGQPKIKDVEGIHILTYDTKFTPYGSALSFHLNEKGYLTIYATFYLKDNGIIGVIKDNYFLLNSDYFSWNFDDKGLEVIDSDMNVLLQVDFVDGNKIKIRGILGNSEMGFVISDNSLYIDEQNSEQLQEEIKKAKLTLKPMFEYVKMNSFGKRIR